MMPWQTPGPGWHEQPHFLSPAVVSMLLLLCAEAHREDLGLQPPAPPCSPWSVPLTSDAAWDGDEHAQTHAHTHGHAHAPACPRRQTQVRVKSEIKNHWNVYETLIRGFLKDKIKWEEVKEHILNIHYMLNYLYTYIIYSLQPLS